MFHRFAAIALSIAAVCSIAACSFDSTGGVGGVASAPAPAPASEPKIAPELAPMSVAPSKFEEAIGRGDKRAAIVLMTAYTAAAKGAALAIRTKVITDKAKIAKIGELSREALAHILRAQEAIARNDAVRMNRSLDFASDEIAKLVNSY